MFGVVFGGLGVVVMLALVCIVPMGFVVCSVWCGGCACGCVWFCVVMCDCV